MEKRYLVITQIHNGDEFVEVFEKMSEANEAAKREWNYLTRWEKQDHHVFVAMVTREDLPDWAIEEDEDGNVEIDWECYHSCNVNKLYFDSERRN